MGATIRGLSKLAPRTLALMHGPSFAGDGSAALRALADDYDRRISEAAPSGQCLPKRPLLAPANARTRQRAARTDRRNSPLPGLQSERYAPCWKEFGKLGT